MSMDAVNEITEIKAQLSRQKWFIRISILGWIGVGTVFLLGAADLRPIKNLRVKRLALIDGNGIERLIIDADNTDGYVGGEPFHRQSPVSGIILQNAKGDEIGGMGTNAAGAAIIALDGYTDIAPGITDRVGLVSLADGTAGFLLNDTKGKTRAMITSGSDLNAELQMSGQDGVPRINGKVGANGSGSLTTNFTK